MLPTAHVASCSPSPPPHHHHAHHPSLHLSKATASVACTHLTHRHPSPANQLRHSAPSAAAAAHPAPQFHPAYIMVDTQFLCRHDTHTSDTPLLPPFQPSLCAPAPTHSTCCICSPAAPRHYWPISTAYTHTYPPGTPPSLSNSSIVTFSSTNCSCCTAIPSISPCSQHGY